MRDLTDILSENLLPHVRGPGQYAGCEINARYADVEAAQVAVVLAFPDTYALGISHLGGQVLYHLLNDIPGVACDRTYCPAMDAQARMKEQGIPLFAWESRRALADFDVLGFSLPYELCVTNVLTMLDLAGLPLHAADRTAAHPLVIAGDALADTPEPMADFIDVFLPGDGEVTLPALVAAVRAAKAAGHSREQLLLTIAQTVPAAYVPRFYQPTYSPSGKFAGLTRLRDDIPAVIERAHAPSLAAIPPAAAPLVPICEAVHERVIIEIMRGCPNGCRFCQAGTTRLPVRTRPIEQIVEAARVALAATGYDEISLLSLSTSDYPHLDELIGRLNAEFAGRHVSISLPSLRVGSQLRALPALTSGVRKGGLTIAAEAATERLRQAIRKDITDADMLAGVQAAYQAGWHRVKIYFMAGLPGETEADLDAIFAICKTLSRAGREIVGQAGSIAASVSWFVPKPHTPMQWCGMRDAAYFWSVRDRLRSLAQRSPVQFKFHWIERSVLEGILCRGDRRVGRLIETAWRNGARLDSWDEHFNYSLWTSALEQTGLAGIIDDLGEIPLDAPLPWSHIGGFRETEFLAKEYQRMRDVLAGSATDAP